MYVDEAVQEALSWSPLGAVPDFSKEIIGEGHPFKGSSGLQFTVKCLRNVSDLDHL